VQKISFSLSDLLVYLERTKTIKKLCSRRAETNSLFFIINLSFFSLGKRIKTQVSDFNPLLELTVARTVEESHLTSLSKFSK
jgi:hypothetical protein